MPKILNYESIPVRLSSTEHLHLSRFYHDENNLGTPVFMLPGFVHDGSIFYTEEGTGLAGYLARAGYDVYVADLRGKGKSRPPVSASSKTGAYQAITEEIPALLNKISDKRGNTAQIWLGHGWGSILLCAVYARYGNQLGVVKKMAHFAARQKAHLTNNRKKIMFNVILKTLTSVFSRILSYLPGRFLGLGNSNESIVMFQDYLSWSKDISWCDDTDNFDYFAAIQAQSLPPSFYFAAKGDRLYGDPEDVRHFIKTLGPHDARLMMLSSKDGNMHDYGHVSLLLHPDSEKDHFPTLLHWLQNS